MKRFDLIFIGSGLSASLAAYRLRQLQPDLQILILEARKTNFPEQTWSFQSLPASVDESPSGTFVEPLKSWLAPFISAASEEYEVRFPAFTRILPKAYYSIRATDLRATTYGSLDYRFGELVIGLGTHRVQTQSGKTYEAQGIIDCRGWSQEQHGAAGYQKFLGLHLRTKQKHGLKRPIVMDACVAQKDGFRFLYVLPWSDQEMLIEDTHYSSDPLINEALYESRILDYARSQGWETDRVLSRERGSLPLPFYGSQSFTPSLVPCLGVRGGFFQPTSGYSIYEAVWNAEWLASQSDLSTEALAPKINQRSLRLEESQTFCRRLNNMLFLAAEPDQRYRILQKFYENPEELVTRFYAGRLSAADKFKIMAGKAPVPVRKAVYHFFHKVEVKHVSQRITAGKLRS